AQLLVVDQMTLRLRRMNFFDENFRIDDDAVADDAELIGMERAGGNQMENSFMAVNDERMSRVIPALKPNYNIGFMGKQIDDFTFAFIAPLGADNCDVCHSC